ncbi:GNAT family N-acetyltransferase [Clostridium sp. LIBA-8841]|uniref:GNAT family N-acetyltransferase n=1 Tax=Clostridium sp. LIBA-8841 TaxID=2987530 RepID=UPI002AC59890|nr:GNAT family N-acetyltransferase [Clostridium sp. LIBA-8841]MDZ5254075.1 GNAT family N-acetyltransferase [Clostridium sp. LIBA-8841]
MSGYIDIQGKKYLYKVDYKGNEILRNSFNELAEKTFGINFEKWYKEGYWSESYIPYSLVYNNKVVANVSVSIMDVMIQGNEKRYIQIGTVMTDEEFRNKGLSRFLMEKIIEEWEDKCDCIHLYANDSVLDFYPKFGFEKYNEYQYSINRVKEKSKEKVRKLNINDTSDKDIFTEIINNRISISKLHVKNNSFLIMFYCLDFMKENIYYIENFNTVVICEYDKDVLYVQEIFSTQEIDLDKVINMLMKEETKKIVLGFTPNNTACYEENLVNEEDTTLFIRAKKEAPFKTEKLMFPILSHA